MRKSIKIQCPAKINLTLRVLNKRDDGFHNIESIMQTIDLFDYLDITLEKSDKNEIILSGNVDTIPYDNRNLVYKAGEIFLEECELSSYKIIVHIEKNIPVSAGLAGGSTNAAGMIYGLNMIFNNILTEEKVNELCAKLGSDLNFCLRGGRVKTSGRGEILEPLEFKQMSVNLIKPIDLGISAKEAYTSFAKKIQNNADKNSRGDYINDLEWAVIDKYPQLQEIKKEYPTSIMTGSGSTYFSLKEEFRPQQGYWVRNGLRAISHGIIEVS